MIYILAALAIFGVLIAVHEWGHYIAARICGVTVHEFAIGMGPKLYHREKNGCLYTLRLLPIGGYCALEGEEEESSDPHSLNNQGFWKKAFIFAAGAGMNFVAGFLIILLLYANAGAFRTAEITGFYEGCPYEGSDGLQAGDVFYSIDGHRVYLFSDISIFLGRGNGETFDLVVLRDGEKVTLEDFPMTPLEYTDDSGVAFTGYGLKLGGVEEATLGAKLRVSWYNAVDFVRIIWLSLGDLVTGRTGMEDLNGPVGIVSAISQVGEQSATVWDAVYNIAYLGALIAVNLAVMNLLPIPALDGGKIFFLAVNALCMLVAKRQIPPKYENYIHAAGFVLLMGLMLVVTFQDVFRLFR